ncbi:hypothetical protein Trydic_g23431 [Trypoxylus dichotomus]
MKCVNLFYHSIKGKILAEMLTDCISTSVKEGDGLPYHICAGCKTKLISSWNFRQLALESEMTLRRNCNETLLSETIKEEPCNFESLELPLITNQDKCMSATENVQELISINKLVDPIAISTGNSYPSIAKEENNEIQNIGCINETTTQNSSDITNIKLSNECSSLKIESSQIQNFDDVNKLESELHSDNTTEINMSEENCEYTSHSNDSTTGVGNTSIVAKKSLENQNQRNKKPKKIRCGKCNKEFSHVYYKRTHIHYHNDGPKLMCKICNEFFESEYYLKKHKATHKGECHICGKIFSSLYKLRLHQTVHIPEDRKCHICNKQLASVEKFRKHILNHEKRFMCELCGTSCPTLRNLNLHRSTHDTEKVLPCATCGKSFASKRRLRAHILWHTKSKPFTCNYCDKTFKTSNSKDRHVLTHTGERPHSCWICGKKFVDTGTLSRHKLTHTGETPFSCDKCPYKCRYKQQFDNHRKKHMEK